MTAYSDFPPPSSAANYMHNREMLTYLRDYANHFNLLEHVRFRHRVLSIYRAKEFATTGQWVVNYENLEYAIVLFKESFAGGALKCSFKFASVFGYFIY